VRYDKILDESKHPSLGAMSCVPTRRATVNESRSYDTSAVSGKALFERLIQACWDLCLLLGVCHEHASNYSFTAQIAADTTLDSTDNRGVVATRRHASSTRHSAQLRNRMKRRDNSLLRPVTLDNECRAVATTPVWGHLPMLAPSCSGARKKWCHREFFVDI
jgi:hypothetical protein